MGGWQGGWRGKLPDIFFEGAVIVRDFERGFQEAREECDKALQGLRGGASDPRRTEVVSRFQKKVDELQRRVEDECVRLNSMYENVQYNALAYNYLYGPEGERGDSALTFFRWLHWKRHRESLNTNARRDERGDLDAWNDFSRTGADYRKLLHRKGPIKPFQGDAIHRELLELLLCFESEHDPLSADERAACFDEFCACGKSHDADALKKQYARLKKDLSV